MTPKKLTLFHTLLNKFFLENFVAVVQKLGVDKNHAI